MGKLNQHVFYDNKVSQCCKQQRDSYFCILTDDCFDCRVCHFCELKMRSTLTDDAHTECLSCKCEITVRFHPETNSISTPISKISQNLYMLIQEKLNSFYYNAVEFLFRNERYTNQIEPILKAVIEGKITIQDHKSCQLDLNKYYLLEFFYKKHTNCMIDYLNKWFFDKSPTKNVTEMAILFQDCVEKNYHDDDELVYNDPQVKINRALDLSRELVKENCII